MPASAAKLQEYIVEENTKGFLVEELYEVFADDGTGRPDPNGLVTPDEAMRVSGVPKAGSTAHPLYTLTTCDSVRVLRVVSNASVIIRATYRSYGWWRGFPRASVRSYGHADWETVPVFHRISNPGGSIVWYNLDDSFTWRRHKVNRVETKYLPGNQIDRVQSAVARNAGNWYTLGGAGFQNTYLLSGESSASYNGGSFTEVTYVYESWAGFPAVAANDPVFKNSLAVPALGNLDDWVWFIDPDDPAAVPLINVVPKEKFSRQGQVLP